MNSVSPCPPRIRLALGIFGTEWKSSGNQLTYGSWHLATSYMAFRRKQVLTLGKVDRSE